MALIASVCVPPKVAKLQRASLVNPVKLEVSNKYGTVKTLLQHYMFIPSKVKREIDPAAV